MEFRYAARRLLRTPALTLTILLILSIAIGGNTAVVSLLNSIVLHPAGIQSPQGLMVPRVKYGKLNIQNMALSGPDFADVKDGREYFASSAAMLSTSLPFRTADSAIQVEATQVTWQFFDVLGTHPKLGRGFQQEEDQPNRNHVVILSDAFWKSQFGANPHVLGRTPKVIRIPNSIVRWDTEYVITPKIPTADIKSANTANDPSNIVTDLLAASD